MNTDAHLFSKQDLRVAVQTAPRWQVVWSSGRSLALSPWQPGDAHLL